MGLFNRVLIVGTGFMGNALATAIHGNQIAAEISGIEPNADYRAQALANGCYTEIHEGLDPVDHAPDLAIVCCPIETVAPVCCELLRRFESTLVTDIASVKEPIIREVEAKVPEHCDRFVPAHPITGSDRSGPIRPPNSIFTDRSCVIVRSPAARPENVQKIEALYRALGSHIFFLTGLEHDELLAMTSHMPHAVASALSAALNKTELKYCGTGIRDTIRIAQSNPLLWQQIFVHNRSAVLRALDRFAESLTQLRRSLETEAIDDMLSILEKGQQNRDALGN